MSASTTTAHAVDSITRGDVPRLTFARVARAEWIKTRSVRSSYWTAAATIAFTVLFAAGVLLLVSVAPVADVPDPAAVIVDNYGAAPGVGVVGFAFMFAYALVAVFGVLVVSTERSTGLLAATLTAVPRRTPVFAAKLIVSAVAGMAIGLVGAIASFLLVQPQLAGLGLGSSLVDPAVLQVLAGGTLYVGLIAVMSTAIASLFKGTAAALGAVLGLLLLAPALIPIIPGIGGEIAGFLPSSAGMMLFQSATQVGWEPIVTGGLVLVGWTIGTVVLAGALFKRRDV